MVIGLLLAGDAWARAIAERRVAAELRGSLGSTGDTAVALGGFPFVVRALSGTIPSAKITTDSLVRKRVRLDRLQMTLEDLTFSLAEISSGEGPIHVRDGRGRAAIEASSLIEAFGALPEPIEIRIGPRGL